MFTIKLYRGHTMKLVQATSVEVFAAGPASEIAEEPKRRTNDVREISAVNDAGGSDAVFYISRGKCWVHETMAQNVYDYAYIENEKGATTEKVYPF